MSPETVWIISTVITVGTALAGFMYALVTGVHKRIDDVRGDLNRLHEDNVTHSVPVGPTCRGLRWERTFRNISRRASPGCSTKPSSPGWLPPS